MDVTMRFFVENYLNFRVLIAKLVLDGSDARSMDGSSSAREPHQVNRITCGFADPSSGTVAHAHSSLDSPRFDLAGVCRLQNDVADVLREVLKMAWKLHEHGTPTTAAFQIKFP